MAQSILLLTIANIFMTFAWYAHLRHFKSSPLIYVILLSWGIALFEYCFQVPANRMGYKFFSLSQLKILQEVITLTIFALFATFYMREPVDKNFLYASFCLVGAVFFIFRK